MLPFRVESIIVIVLHLSWSILMSGVLVLSSIKNFKYFLLFVDDISRMTWLYLLKERSEVSSVIEPFFNEIKNQFSISIHVLHTDNALEFVKKRCIYFLFQKWDYSSDLLLSYIPTKWSC